MITFREFCLLFFKQLDVFQEILIDHLQRMADNDPLVPRLGCSMPPGYGKTKIAELFMMWMLVRDVKENCLYFGKDSALAGMVGGACATIANSETYRKLNPHRLIRQTQSEFTFDAPGGNGRPSAHFEGILGGGTGYRASVLVTDDLVKNLRVATGRDLDAILEALKSVALTRQTSKAKWFSIGTRWVGADPQGFFHSLNNRCFIKFPVWNSSGVDAWIEYADGSKVFLPAYENLATIAGTTFSHTLAALQQMADDMGVLFEPLFLQRTVDKLLAQFALDDIIMRATIDSEQIAGIIIGVDPAATALMTADYSVATAVAQFYDGTLCVLDLLRGRWEYPQLKDTVVEFARSMRTRYSIEPVVIIEYASNGIPLFDEMKTQYSDVLVAKGRHLGDGKRLRAMPVASKVRSHQFAVLSGQTWTEGLIDELVNFGTPKYHDDQVDSTVWAVLGFIGGERFEMPTHWTHRPGRLGPGGRLSIATQADAIENAEADLAWNDEVRILDDEPEEWL
jgi:predicted phage terminase large subunit-like protein